MCRRDVMKARGAENRKKVLAALIAAEEPTGTTAIAQRTGMSYNAASNYLNALVVEGIAARAAGGRGLYFLVDRELHHG